MLKIRDQHQQLCHNEQLFRIMVESVKEYAIFAMNREGYVVSWNTGAERIFGYTEAEITGQHVSIIFTPEDNAQEIPQQEMRDAAATGRGEDERWHIRKDGTRFWAGGLVMPLRDDAGELLGFVKVARDQTEQKRVEGEHTQLLRKLKTEQALLKTVIQHMPAGVMLAEAPSGKILLTNKQLESVLRHPVPPAGYLDGYSESVSYHPDGRRVEGHEYPLARALQGEFVTGDEYLYQRGDETKAWIRISGAPIHDSDEQIIGGIVTVYNIDEEKRAEDELRRANDDLEKRVEERTAELSQANTNLVEQVIERKLAEKRLVHEASHDALTGLPNRALFLDHLRRAIARAERHQNYLFAVLFIDLDRFKLVNDSLGHIVGDRLLVAAARKLESVLRPEDVVARLGGDEFTILLSDINGVSDTTTVAERIHKKLASPFTLDGHDVFTAASIGIALSSPDYTRPEEILRDADTAMYRAKVKGRAGHQIFDPSMHQRAVARLKLETGLRRAIERDEFCLHYQPIVSLLNGNLTGFEALVRWQHPERGLVPPDEFITVAEETGLIVQIGRWVLGEACRQMQQWQNLFPATPPRVISVNLSGKQLMHSKLIEQVTKILHDTNLDPHNLRLEITESVVMEKSEITTAILKQLRALGVELAIDDFGTGYSSLGYLHRFPVSTLKIDRTFISRMGAGDENWEIVRTIMVLAGNLGMNVVAEGVETTEQLSQLQSLGCEYGQGYLFSKPVQSEIAEALLVM